MSDSPRARTETGGNGDAAALSSPLAFERKHDGAEGAAAEAAITEGRSTGLCAAALSKRGTLVRPRCQMTIWMDRACDARSCGNAGYLEALKHKQVEKRSRMPFSARSANESSHDHALYRYNVLLSFYHLTSEDIEELKKLVVLVKNNEISLIVPKQVEDEFWRNRGGKISDAMKKLRGARFNASFPAVSKDYGEYVELRTLLKKADKLHAELVSKIMADAKDTSLNADEVVTGLLKEATKPEFDDDHYLSALRRVRLGNPPGKNESLGDAINWETLLLTVDEGTDLYLVSEDKDYRSQLSEGVFNEFLRKEWETKKKSSLIYYSKISDFFKDCFPDIKIASQIETDLAINCLSNSGSFASTHVCIGKLDTFDQFTIAQVERLVKIPGQNAQVGWIIDDTDVHEFYSKLLDKYGGGLKDGDYELLKELVEKGKPEPEQDDPLA